MNKPWLQHYPEAVPTEIDVAPVPTLVEMIDRALVAHAARPALTSMGKTISFAALDELASHMAAWLQMQGIAKGDRVALMMPNITPFVVSAIGVLRCGGTVVTVNPMYTQRELLHQLKDSGSETIIILDAFTGTLDAVLADTAVKRIVVVQSSTSTAARPARPEYASFVDALAEGATLKYRPVAVGPEDLAFLQYTGGTTGVSKGAMLLHRNLVANIAQIEVWNTPAFGGQLAGLNIVSFIPLYHIFALTFCMLFGLRNGLHHHLVANPRDIAGSVQDLAGTPVHILPGVNTLFAGLLSSEALTSLNLSELRLTAGGGAAIHQAIAERWLAHTGVPILEGYGLTETSPVVSAVPPSFGAWTGSVGMPVPNTEIVIRDDEGRDVPFGERGEICIRGPQVMVGYWRRPDDTAQVFTEDGFLKSGDVGIMSERGFVSIVDRKKDMILVSGFNVFPNEIESVIAMLPGVLEVAAIGVPDERSGEAVKVLVVRSDPALTEAQVRQHCRDNLTGYKNPRHVEFRESLPKSGAGKILRRNLRV